MMDRESFLGDLPPRSLRMPIERKLPGPEGTEVAGGLGPESQSPPYTDDENADEEGGWR